MVFFKLSLFQSSFSGSLVVTGGFLVKSCAGASFDVFFQAFTRSKHISRISGGYRRIPSQKLCRSEVWWFFSSVHSFKTHFPALWWLQADSFSKTVQERALMFFFQAFILSKPIFRISDGYKRIPRQKSCRSDCWWCFFFWFSWFLTDSCEITRFWTYS